MADADENAGLDPDANVDESPDSDANSTSRSTLALVTFGLQLIVAGALLYSIVFLDLTIVFNTAVALVIALFPVAVERWYGYRLSPVLVAFIAAGAAFHAVGSLGFYESLGLYDQVAHAVAGGLVAGIGYAIFQVVDTQHDGIYVPPKLRFVFVLVFAMAVGVFWEILEFSAGLTAEAIGGEPLLTQYGLEDTVLDLAADGIGAVLVALWGTSYFDDLRRILNDKLGSGRRASADGGPGDDRRDSGSD